MTQTFNNILNQDEIDALLKYHYLDDDRTDNRPDVRSKHPRWNIDDWPQHVVQKVFDAVLNDPYTVEEVIFNESRISFRLHADSSDGNNLYKVILIPLKTDGPSHTVFFNNYWHGPSTKFSKVDINPYRYQLPNKEGKYIWVDDVRSLLQQCQLNPTSIIDFEVTDQFIKDLKYVISVRQNNGLSYVDNRTNDYSDIINYNSELVFDNELHNQYLSHIDIESLHGLTVDQICEWIPGNIIVFDRTQLHAASSTHTQKIGLTIFTKLA